MKGIKTWFNSKSSQKVFKCEDRWPTQLLNYIVIKASLIFLEFNNLSHTCLDGWPKKGPLGGATIHLNPPCQKRIKSPYIVLEGKLFSHASQPLVHVSSHFSSSLWWTTDQVFWEHNLGQHCFNKQTIVLIWKKLG